MVGVPQLPANHTSISRVPAIITHSAPDVIYTNLHRSIIVIVTGISIAPQPNISILTSPVNNTNYLHFLQPL